MWELLWFSGALLVGFVVVLTWRVEPLVFGVELASLLENPTISVGMVRRLPGSTVYLTYLVQDFVSVRKLVPVILKGQFFMILPRAFESGVDCRAHRAVILDSALFLATAWFPVSISDFGCTWVAGATSCQPAVLYCAKAGHEVC